MIPSNFTRQDSSSKNSESRSRSDSSESILSSPKIIEPVLLGSKRKSTEEQSDSSLYLDASSDDEWKPNFLKGERKIDPDKIVDIKTANQPLFGPVRELADISDLDEGEDDDESVLSLEDIKREFFAAPHRKLENEIEDSELGNDIEDPEPENEIKVKEPEIPEASLKQEKSTGAIKKIRSPPKVKFININKNPEAVRIIRKLVEYFTFHNSLPKREKEKYKHKLSSEIMTVLSQVLDDFQNSIYEQILERIDSQQINIEKKVKTKNVACQTVITGDVLSSALLPKVDGKVNNVDVKKNDMDAVVDLLNEHIISMKLNDQLP